MRTKHNSCRKNSGYCRRSALMAGLGLVLLGTMALSAAAQPTGAGYNQFDPYPYYEGGFRLRRETRYYPPPVELQRDRALVYGYDAQPAPLERDLPDLGLRRRPVGPMADPRNSSRVEPLAGYLHGYDYRYDQASGSRDPVGHQFLFHNDYGEAGQYRRLNVEEPDFQARYGPGVNGNVAGINGYRGDPTIYGYRDQQGYRPSFDTYGYYEGDELGPGDYQPLTTPQTNDPQSYYPPFMDRMDRMAFDARWPRHLRPQYVTPRLMPHERAALRQQDLARLRDFQQRPPLAYRQSQSWQEVENYAHQWSDPAVRRQREFLAQQQGGPDGQVYGYDDPRTIDQRWRDEERMRVMRERQERQQQMQEDFERQRQLESDTYGYSDRPPTAAGGRADDRRYWGRGDSRYWGPPEGRYWDYEGRRWWVDRDGAADQSTRQQTPGQQVPSEGAAERDTGPTGSGATDANRGADSAGGGGQ